jgi:hypothetical protein
MQKGDLVNLCWEVKGKREGGWPGEGAPDGGV